MTHVPAQIFRQYDIRGMVTGMNPQITPELARLVGKGYGTYMQRTFQTDRVFVGSDNRLTSPPIKAGLIEGILSTGLNVTDIGQVMTPTVYYASAQYGARGGGVQITGSHLTLEYNGIKMAYDRFALYGDQIQAILKSIQEDDYEVGRGTLDHDPDMVSRHLQTIASKVKLGPRKLRVVLDAGNSLSGLYMQPVYEQLGVEVICLYCEPDGTFPNHLPNPEDPTTTKDLERLVIETGADLGIAFDGDADRCGIIDEHGHHIAADRLLALLARDMLDRVPGATVVFDVKASQALFDEIRGHRGVPLMWKTGHSVMKAKMAEVGSPLGGEVSGHIFIGEDYYGFDDAPLVSLKVLDIFSKTDQSVSAVFDTIPKLVATPEIILPAPDDMKFNAIAELQDYFRAKYEVVDIDGARVMFEDGWGLVRASNTQPAITLRFEARTRPQIVEYMTYFDRQLAAYPQIDRARLQAQIAAFSR
jgi:phosphomannomutase/phosphoglucomutase